MPIYKYNLICKVCHREFPYTRETDIVQKFIFQNKRCRECQMKAGLIKKGYPSTFYRNKKIVLKRDENKCQNCKKEKNPDRNIYVHHIDADTLNNSPSNLITLCSPCHVGLHKRFKNEILRRSNIFSLFAEMKKEKQKERISFLSKVKKIRIKPKLFQKSIYKPLV